MKSRIKMLALTLLILSSGILAYATLTRGHNWGGDFSAYIMQAKSIVNGTIDFFLENNSFTIEKSSKPMGPIAYPWGFPILLSPIYYVYGVNLIALKTINIFCFTLFLVCIFWLFKERVSYIENLIIVSFFAFNPSFLQFHNNILSDIPFLFFSTFSLLLIDRIIVSKCRIISPSIDNILLGIVTFFTFLIRSNGILLLPTIFVCQSVQLIDTQSIEKKGFKAILYTYSIPYTIFILLYSFSSFVFPQGGISHISYFYALTLPLIKSNVLHYFQAPAIIFYSSTIDMNIVYKISIVFLIIGIIVNFRKDYHFVVYSLLTLFLYVFWPDNKQSLRFLFPMLPFYIYFTFKGMKWCNFSLTKKIQKMGKVLIYVFCIFVVASFALTSFNLASTNISNNRSITGPFDPIAMDMFNFISSQTDSNDVIVFFKPRVMRMITNRKSVMINEVSQLYRGYYLVIHKYGGVGYQVTPQDLTNYKGVFNLNKIYENANFIVFRITKDYDKSLPF